MNAEPQEQDKPEANRGWRVSVVPASAPEVAVPRAEQGTTDESQFYDWGLVFTWADEAHLGIPNSERK